MIWTILILTGVFGLCSGALATGHHRATEAARQAWQGSKPPVAVGCVLTTIPWLIAACWIVYAFQVSDWRFAAIALIPKAAALLIYLARPRAA